MAVPPAQIRAREILGHGCSQRTRVLWLNQAARLTVTHELRIAADPCGDDGSTRGHRLENRVGDTLVDRAQHEYVDQPEKIADIVSIPQKTDPGSRELPEPIVLRPVADDEQREIGKNRTQLGECPKERG